jgi:hypothetical protein
LQQFSTPKVIQLIISLTPLSIKLKVNTIKVLLLSPAVGLSKAVLADWRCWQLDEPLCGGV